MRPAPAIISTALDALVIHNPWAGTSPAKDAVLEAVEWWRSHGWKVELAETRGPGDSTFLARRAAEAGKGAVIVAGGDGTLSQAANGLANSQTALGLLAVGTGNIWARDIGVPILTGRGVKAATEAARILAQGTVRQMDLGRVGDHYFMLWLGLGLDGHIVSHVEPRGRLAKSLGMPYYFLAAVLRPPAGRARASTWSWTARSSKATPS